MLRSIVFGGLAALGVATGALMTDQTAEANWGHGWHGHHHHHHHGWHGHYGSYGYRPYSYSYGYSYPSYGYSYPSYGYSYPSYRTYYYSPGWTGYGHYHGHWDDDDD